MIELIQQLYIVLGVGIVVNMGDVYGLASLIIVTIAALGQWPRVSKRPQKLEQKLAPDEKITVPIISDIEKTTTKPRMDWNQRLLNGLGSSRKQVWGKIGALFNGTPLNDEQIETLEELLYGADLGPKTTMDLMKQLEDKAKEANFTEDDFKSLLSGFIRGQMETVQNGIDQDLFSFDPAKKGKTKVVMIVGVNGAGKTTTIGKIATKLTAQGAKVVVGACDTFRAAAVDQLQVWCERAGAQMVRAKEGANPTGVGYDALQMALNEKADYCLLDTAGRLHNKQNLMEELTKSKNVLMKLDEQAPDHVLLVIDAITGQNALNQAKEFNAALGLTGLIFTKCDGSSKAGSAVSIVKELQVPITYIGVGESVEDLDRFDLDAYLNALLGISTITAV